MSNVWINTFNKINTVITAVPGIIDCHAGYHRYTDSENWEFDTTELTPEVQGRFRFNIDTIVYKPLDASIGYFYGELGIYLPKEVTTPMTNAWTLATNVQYALGDQANFADLGVVPQQILMCLDRIDVVATGGIGYWVFGRTGSGGIEYIDP